MDKIDCVLLVLNKEFLEKTVKSLNFGKVNLTAIFMDGSGEKFFKVEENSIPVDSFANIYSSAKKYKNFTWLISGYDKNLPVRRIKKFLMNFGVSEKNIFSFEIFWNASAMWIENYKHIEKNGADFFATGDEYFRDALDFNFIPCVQRDKNSALGGVNLADVNQNLRQSFWIAGNIFSRIKPGTIKFVLIGLSPYSLHRDNAEGFFNHQWLHPPKNEKPVQADLNFSAIKKDLNREFSAQSLLDWEENPREISNNAVEKNLQILKDYIKLCLANGAKPVGVVFPFAPAARKNFDKKILTAFREKIHQLEAESDFFCVDMFELNLNYDCFCDMVHLNLKGSEFANAVLSMKLQMRGLIPVENFGEMTYQYLNKIALVANKNDYNKFAEEIFKVSAKKIGRKDKIKLGFVAIDSAQWSGDDLYNLFANDERFEVTIFDCLRTDKSDNNLIIKDFWKGIDQFKSRGLNVVALDKRKSAVPAQDVLIFLTPYFNMIPLALRPPKLSLNTLTAHIPYSFSISVRNKNLYNRNVFNTAWKVFVSSKIALELFAEKNRLDLPRGLYSGYPRMDVFFEKKSDLNFDWKMARPDAKKIIYAPHWSINEVTKYATFQWNHKFMYEFAKAHPEISWVIKPHQALFFSTVKEKVFPSTAAYEEYLQKWNDLPNAQVYTGAYYQGLFATSDGMIHDSGSFIAEYQFVNKPMIFLTREGEVFNKLGQEILKVSYLVDGKDLDAIAEMMQKVFIEGDDYKATERKEVYDKYLNYFEYNGMLASEFIYKSIADGLKGES